MEINAETTRIYFWFESNCEKCPVRMDQINKKGNHDHAMEDGIYECDAIKLNCPYCQEDYFVSGKFPRYFKEIDSHHCLEPNCLEENKKEIWRKRRMRSLKEIDQGLESIKNLNRLNEVITEMEEKAQKEDWGLDLAMIVSKHRYRIRNEEKL